MTADERVVFDETHAATRLALDVGEKVRGARAAAGLSQRELAAALGLSRTEYLRRALARERDAQSTEVSVADLAGFAGTFADLDDPDIMGRAWR